jgi:hypothetical protein
VAGFMTGEERDTAEALGADVYLRTKRFKVLKEEHIFPALDGAVAALKSLKFPDPYNGHILAASAAVIIRNDTKALGEMRQKKIAALMEGDKAKREELFLHIGLLISEKYLAARKGKVPAESLIATADSILGRLGDVFEQMAKYGKEMSQVKVRESEEAYELTKDIPDAGNIAEALIGRVIGSYESLVPPTDPDGDLPTDVEHKAVAKAAFLRLGVGDLAELVAEQGIQDVPTKAAMAKALADKFKDDLDEVARLTLRETEGDPAFGLVTRLLPLSSQPDIKEAQIAFQALRSHYFEVRPAVFFVFGDVTLSADNRFLTVKGSIRSFTVNPVEVGGEANLNSRPRKDSIVIKLQEGERWATVTARRASDLTHIGAVLRRSGEVSTSGAVSAPAPLPTAPYSTWDSRSLWMLELFRRDLQADALKLQDTLMANFDSSKGSDLQDEDDDGEKPRLASVKLKGRQLQDHPEVCARIVGRAHLRDVEFRLRKVTDQKKGFSTLTLIRLAWERDHLAIMTGADGDTLDTELHRRLVRLARDAVDRPLSTELIPMLERIETRSKETDVEAGASGVLTGDGASPPEPEEGEITVSAGDGTSG